MLDFGGRMSFASLLKISRPRFWLYTAGPFFVGSVIGAKTLSELFSVYTLSLFFFFLLPVNILIYGVNDLFDLETDTLNPKKGTKEFKISSAEIVTLRILVVLLSFLAFVIFLLQPTQELRALGLLFLFLSLGYSAPPLRFKARPFFDSFSNGLYIVPGLLAYSYFFGELPGILVISAVWAWAMAMHLYSAIPDIAYDKAVGLKTTAVMLGEKMSLLVCLLLWGFFAVQSFYFVGINLVTVLFLVYPGIPLAHLFLNKLEVKKIYWLFPYITTGIGMLATVLLMQKFM